MPVLRSLDDRLALDSSWKSDFDSNLGDASSVADRVAIIHVTTAGAVVADFTGLGPRESTRTTEWVRRSASTAASEGTLGWSDGAKTYFYAGRACPDFGGLALAFDSTCEQERQGWVTPFDSGGLVHGYIHVNFEGGMDRSRFVADSRIDIQQWRFEFARYLAAYFAPLTAYWRDRPYRLDPDGIFNNGNHWRAWVFELCLEGYQDFSQAIVWSSSREHQDIVRKGIINGVLPFERGALSSFLDRELSPGGAEDYAELIEDWVLSQVGL